EASSVDFTPNCSPFFSHAGTFVIGTLRSNRAPRLTGCGASVVDGPSRLGLEYAGEVVGHELLVASEVEAVVPRNRGGDTTKGRGERRNNDRLGHFPVTGMLGGHLHERLGQEGSSTEVRGSDRYGRRRRLVHG